MSNKTLNFDTIGEREETFPDRQGKTPLDYLIEGEESESDTAINAKQIRAEAIIRLMMYLFNPIGKFVPSPQEVATRTYILAKTLCPELIGNLSLAEIGQLFGTSRQTMSKRLIKNDKTLNIRSTDRKPDGAIPSYRGSAMEVHREKKRIKRREERRAYLKQYKAERKEMLKEYNREYYMKRKQQIRERIKRNKCRRS